QRNDTRKMDDHEAPLFEHCYFNARQDQFRQVAVEVSSQLLAARWEKRNLLGPCARDDAFDQLQSTLARQNPAAPLASPVLREGGGIGIRVERGPLLLQDAKIIPHNPPNP